MTIACKVAGLLAQGDTVHHQQRLTLTPIHQRVHIQDYRTLASLMLILVYPAFILPRSAPHVAYLKLATKKVPRFGGKLGNASCYCP